MSCMLHTFLLLFKWWDHTSLVRSGKKRGTLPEISQSSLLRETLGKWDNPFIGFLYPLDGKQNIKKLLLSKVSLGLSSQKIQSNAVYSIWNKEVTYVDALKDIEIFPAEMLYEEINVHVLGRY